MSFSYSVAIRTLGTAGEKFQRLLDSLSMQTIAPEGIYVYIAEGYPLPKETINKEKYIYVKKGMLAQRALEYHEIDSEYILFTDDDLVLPPNAVELMSTLLFKYSGDVISPDIFNNAKRGHLSELLMTLSGRMRPRRDDGRWGYKVMANGGYSYNKSPKNEVYESQTNAGACFLCKKNVFQSICLENELWVDRMPYPIGEDQITYYKMFKKGLKVLTYYNHNIIHLDGGNNLTSEKEKIRLHGDLFFKIVFWHRFIFKPDNSYISKAVDCLAIGYYLLFSIFISTIKFRFDILAIKLRAMKDGVNFIQSDEYKNLPKI